MTTISKEGNYYTIDRGTGTVTLTINEVSLLVNQFMKNGLRESIESLAHEMDGDTINLAMYPYTLEEFFDEIYVDMENKIDSGNYPDDEAIKDKIQYTADYYDMTI